MVSLPATLLPTALLTIVVIVAATTSPAAYRVRRTDADAVDLLRAADPAWSAASTIEWGTQPWPTRFRALATDTALWLRFDATDDSPWHTLEQRDDPLWDEEVVEIFIDPDNDGRNYVEIEINPANIVCDLLMERGDPGKIGHLEWDFPGLETRVVPLHDGDGATIGWTALARLPWEGFADAVPEGLALPPRAGDRWSFNVFRIKRPDGPTEPHRRVILDAWSPVPAGSFHVPEVFQPLEFE